ncbi:MAG: dihydropyrimidinase [Bacteroidales bacterium]|nr:dihydropyrimidinase [Bacteroidales bacterium]
MNSILIINGTVISGNQKQKADIAIRDGKIVSCGNLDLASYSGYQILDASGKYIIPGGFDPHVHLALPTPAGNSCDDFLSGSQAALSGGTTSIMDFVTPIRGQSLSDALIKRKIEAKSSLACWDLHLGISEWNPAIAAEILPCMEKFGVTSFKAYLAYRETIGIGYHELKELMYIVKPANGMVMVHCEDGEMVSRMQKNLLNEGKVRPAYHARSRPPETEIRAIEKVIELSDQTGCPAYIVHISTRRGAEMVAAAKKSGIPVYGETCPHYLLLDDSVYDLKQSDRDVLPFVFSPPVRKKNDQQGLWEAVANGSIDVVSTDHCPFNLHGQKDKGISDFTKIPNGTGGIEHRLTLLYTYGVLTHQISLNQFVALVSANPARIFGFGNHKGKLEPGYDADIVVWDPVCETTISVQTHRSNCDSEIYEGFHTQGRAEKVLIGGEIKFQQND